VPLRVGCVEVHIERWPLAAGRYGCTLFGSVNGVIADWVQNVGTFEVEGGDYYGTGRLPPPNQGPYLIDHYFSLRD
jgi:lipopolysaccharide transport system ATP-binding protein